MEKEAFIKPILKRLLALRVPKGIAETAKAVAPAVAGKLPKTAPDWFVKSLHGVKDPDRVYRAMRHQSVVSGDESLLLWPVRALATKVLPGKYKRKARKFMWDYVGKPALRIDTTLGRGLEKIPVVGKHMFRVTEQVPWKKGHTRAIQRSSALAPLIKARDIAEPILVGVGLEKGIKKLDEMRHQGNGMQDEQLRTKVASVMLQLHEKNKEHEKRAHALKLLYKQAELGIAQLPSTHGELEIKLASLVNEDLVVLEKALELSGGNLKLGELSLKDSVAVLNPSEKFQATILGEEL